MFDLPKNKIGIIAALFAVTMADGTINPDATDKNSQIWTLDNDTTATITPQADGTAKIAALTPDTLGSVTVNYTANGVNADGVTVPLAGSEIYNLVDAIIPPVTVPLTTVLENA